MAQPTPRIIKETQNLAKDKVQGIDVTPDPGNFKHFFVIISGPPNTPYEGGVFDVELLLPDDYPMSPPKCVFNTKIYHPNIDNLGRICLDVLQSSFKNRLKVIIKLTKNLQLTQKIQNVYLFATVKDKWSPALQIRSILLSIQVLLSSPNPDDPLNNEAANLWKANEGQALMKAKEYTLKYAKKH